MSRSAPADALTEVRAFLHCATPDAWYQHAVAHIPVLLIDHANCEKKAAGNALSLMYRYVEHAELQYRMSRLAREELRHFEQVHAHMQARDITYRPLSASRYAAGLRRLMRTREPHRLMDALLMGAVVEARSCERFAGLIEVLPDAGLRTFYTGLLASEARHYAQYLSLARRCVDLPIQPKLDELLAEDARLVTQPDTDFRFHSGPPERSIPA